MDLGEPAAPQVDAVGRAVQVGSQSGRNAQMGLVGQIGQRYPSVRRRDYCPGCGVPAAVGRALDEGPPPVFGRPPDGAGLAAPDRGDGAALAAGRPMRRCGGGPSLITSGLDRSTTARAVCQARPLHHSVKSSLPRTFTHAANHGSRARSVFSHTSKKSMYVRTSLGTAPHDDGVRRAAGQAPDTGQPFHLMDVSAAREGELADGLPTGFPAASAGGSLQGRLGGQRALGELGPCDPHLTEPFITR